MTAIIWIFLRDPNRSPLTASSHDTGSSAEPFSTSRVLAGIIDRALNHWGHVPPLNGGTGGNDHADSETDTAIPDDEDDQDIASLASQPSVSVQASSL